MKIENLLREEIESEFEELSKMELGSEAYRATVDGLTKLCDRAIELEKFNGELREKVNSRMNDTELREKEAKNDKTNKIVGHCINVAGIVLPLALTVWGTKASFKFEQDGTITTLMGRGFINKLLPKMK